MFRKLSFHPQVDEYNPQDIPSCNVYKIIKNIWMLKRFLKFKTKDKKMENTDDRFQSHWTLGEHYNKVASSAKINCPSAAHGVRF
jgi:hypothetical protein